MAKVVPELVTEPSPEFAPRQSQNYYDLDPEERRIHQEAELHRHYHNREEHDRFNDSYNDLREEENPSYASKMLKYFKSIFTFTG